MTAKLRSICIAIVASSLLASAMAGTAGAAAVSDGHEADPVADSDLTGLDVLQTEGENTTDQPANNQTEEQDQTQDENATEEPANDLSEEQRQAIVSGVQAGITELERAGISTSQQERETVIAAATEGADPRSNSIVLEETAFGLTYGVIGEGATQTQIEAAVRGSMAGVSQAAIEQQNVSQIEIVFIADEVAMGAARGAVVGGVQNQNVNEGAIEAAASGTARGGIEGAAMNLAAPLDEILFVTHRTSLATTNLAAEDPEMATDDLERIANVFTRTGILEFPESTQETEGTTA